MLCEEKTAQKEGEVQVWYAIFWGALKIVFLLEGAGGCLARTSQTKLDIAQERSAKVGLCKTAPVIKITNVTDIT